MKTKFKEFANKIYEGRMKDIFTMQQQGKSAEEIAKMLKINVKVVKSILGEEIEGIKKKSEKSGVPYSILKKVYDRGMAAWKGGHRPGTTPQQWAFARINSFLTKGKTYHTADKDLAKQSRKN
jgi:predicted RNase H-like HicB family nuclease